MKLTRRQLRKIISETFDKDGDGKLSGNELRGIADELEFHGDPLRRARDAGFSGPVEPLNRFKSKKDAWEAGYRHALKGTYPLSFTYEDRNGDSYSAGYEAGIDEEEDLQKEVERERNIPPDPEGKFGPDSEYPDFYTKFDEWPEDVQNPFDDKADMSDEYRRMTLSPDRAYDKE